MLPTYRPNKSKRAKTIGFRAKWPQKVAEKCSAPDVQKAAKSLFASNCEELRLA